MSLEIICNKNSDAILSGEVTLKGYHLFRACPEDTIHTKHPVMESPSDTFYTFCAVRILASTVAEERERQRKNSRKLPSSRSFESGTHACYTGPQGLVHMERLSREEQDYLGLERIRRAERLPELAQDFGLGESDDSGYGLRDRSYRYVTMIMTPQSNSCIIEQRHPKERPDIRDGITHRCQPCPVVSFIEMVSLSCKIAVHGSWFLDKALSGESRRVAGTLGGCFMSSLKEH